MVRHLAELWARRKDSSREATGYAARDRKFGNVQAVSCGHDHTAGHRAREHRGLEGERGCGEGQSHFAIRSAADLQPFIHLLQTQFSTVKCTYGPIQNARVLAPESGCAVSAGSMPSARELP